MKVRRCEERIVRRGNPGFDFFVFVMVQAVIAMKQ
jgi:hypothetical protein